MPIKAKFDPRHLPWVTFTDPEIAHVGLTEEEAKKAGRSCSAVRFPYTHNERAVTDQKPVGRDPTRRDPTTIFKRALSRHRC
ncbi:MAG: hypothetical protein ACRDZ4_21150 [Egibacteraceae bacterium]